MQNKIKFELDKKDWDYTRILEFLLTLENNAKIINYEDDDQFMDAPTIIICDRGPEIEGALSANNYKYDIIKI